jgi:hypothetical protein
LQYEGIIAMATNQLHGKKLEDLIKAEYSGSSDQGRISTSAFDIEAKYDSCLHLDTSVKCKKIKKNNNELIELADARRFFDLDQNFRVLLIRYTQVGEIKTVVSIIEYIITQDALNKMKGDLTLDIVTDFHNALKSYPFGKHKEARIFHKQRNKELKGLSSIKLNPKVDSKTQRRLQCSIQREKLESFLPPENIIVHTEFFKELVLPISIKSGTRKFNN